MIGHKVYVCVCECAILDVFYVTGESADKGILEWLVRHRRKIQLPKMQLRSVPETSAYSGIVYTKKKNNCIWELSAHNLWPTRVRR